MEEDLPLPNIIEAEIDKGFGEMNLDDLTAPELGNLKSKFSNYF